MRLIPAFINRHIENRPNLLKIVENISWLFFDKILRMGGGLRVGVGLVGGRGGWVVWVGGMGGGFTD